MSKQPCQRSASRWCFVVYGAVFEGLLLAIYFAIHQDSDTSTPWLYVDPWFSIQFGNGVKLVHYPLLLLLDAIERTYRNASTVLSLAPLWVVLVMSVFWGCLFYWATQIVRKVLGEFQPSELQKRWIRRSALVLALAAPGAGFWIFLPDRPRPFARTATVDEWVDQETTFSLELYRKLREPTGNLFFSPHAVYSSLAVLLPGAKGVTATEIATVLHCQKMAGRMPAAAEGLNDRLQKIQRLWKVKLRHAKSIWYQKNEPLLPAYSQLVSQGFSAEVRPVDFESDAVGAAGQLADWTSRHTGGGLSNSRSADTMPASTRMILADAIFFDARWQTPFPVEQTSPSPFYLGTNQIKQVQMMRGDGKFKHIWDPEANVEILELPYLGGDLSMVVLMEPRENFETFQRPYDLDRLENTLEPKNFRRWIRELDSTVPEHTEVALPRFTARKRLDLVSALQLMGITTAFTQGADFSGLNGNTNLFVNNLLQDASVEVTESGTKATALNLMFVATAGITPHFVADHPFLYLIRDCASGEIYFVGRFADPDSP